MKWDLTMSVFGLESCLVGYEQEMLFQRTLVLGTDKQPSLASTVGGIQYILLTSKSTRHTCDPQTHSQAKHTHTHKINKAIT